MGAISLLNGGWDGATILFGKDDAKFFNFAKESGFMNTQVFCRCHTVVAVAADSCEYGLDIKGFVSGANQGGIAGCRNMGG